MKLTEGSHDKLQTFFRELLDDESFNLPVIDFYAGRFSRGFTLILQVHGITFGRRIFIMPDLISKDFENRRKLSLELAAHEIVHVLQYKKDGFGKFFYKYLSGYWKNLRAEKNWDSDARQQAYRDIPYEREAREIAARFVVWNRNKKIIG
jgi:hypothetical protein